MSEKLTPPTQFVNLAFARVKIATALLIDACLRYQAEHAKRPTPTVPEDSPKEDVPLTLHSFMDDVVGLLAHARTFDRFTNDIDRDLEGWALEIAERDAECIPEVIEALQNVLVQENAS